jgi:hypothetical protein
MAYFPTNTSPAGQVSISNGTTSTTSIPYTTNTTTATNYNWAVPTNYDQVMTVNAGEKEATLAVKGNLVINGRDLEERLTTIEKVLDIPERDVALEKKHPKLKKLYNDYITALGKYRTWEAVKGEE